MPESPTSLRRKIGSAAELQSVVRAMKAQAAASIGRYEQAVAALGDYARTVELGLGAGLRARAPVAEAPGPGAVARRVIVFGSDQGLVGRFNDIVLDFARHTLAAGSGPPAQIWAVGERVREGLTTGGVSLGGAFPVPASVPAITGLVGRILIEVALLGDAGAAPAAKTEFHLFFNRPVQPSGFAPQTQRLLPLDGTWVARMAELAWPRATRPEVMVGAAGDPDETLGALIREHLFISIFRACAESLASENASRLAAMERADRNIDRMLADMQSRFQRLRQGNIDAELSDLVSGFRALRPAV